jgi:predicted MPP superfamily phosphohydrolase
MSKKNKGAKRRNCDKKRKKAAKWFLGIIAVLLVAVLATGGVNYYLNQSFTVSFYQITSDKVSSNIRIIELADLHNSEFGENNSKLISRIESLHPDIIVYAGDMMNEGESDHSVLFDLSDKLSKIAPIYACYGNNELDQQLFIDDSRAAGWHIG